MHSERCHTRCEQTPNIANVRITAKSFRNSHQLMYKEGSKTSGGKKASKIRSLVRVILIAPGTSARPIPASTNPAVVGTWSRRASMPTIAVTRSTISNCAMIDAMDDKNSRDFYLQLQNIYTGLNMTLGRWTMWNDS
jgi:hypothetical protein